MIGNCPFLMNSSQAKDGLPSGPAPLAFVRERPPPPRAFFLADISAFFPDRTCLSFFLEPDEFPGPRGEDDLPFSHGAFFPFLPPFFSCDIR